MTGLFLREKDRLAILDLLDQYLPEVTAWAYGSRVNGGAHEGSDLDIVLRAPDLSPIPIEAFRDFVEALRESNIPILVEARDWARLPEFFQEEILRGYVVLKEGEEGLGEWKSLAINQLGEVVTGKTPSQNNPEDWGDEIPFVTPSDYKLYRKKAYSSSRNLSSCGRERLNKKILPPQSILVTCIGSDMGKVVMNSIPVITNQQINSIIPNCDLIDCNFMYYALVNMYEVLKVYGGDGTAVPIVNKRDFSKIDVEFPPLPEQKAIASVLSSLDDKIDLLHRQNKTLEGMAEALFRQWFIEEAGDDWEEGCLGDVAVNMTNSVKPQEIKPEEIYIGLEHIDKRTISLSNKGRGEEVASNKYSFQKGDILFGKLRPYFHKVCFAPFAGICSTDILVIRPKEKHLFGYCLFAFFQNDVVEYANLGSGGTRMPRTNWKVLSQYPMAMPTDNRLKEFNELITPSIEKIEQNQKQIRTLEKLRNTLLPKLMTGEVRVQHV